MHPCQAERYVCGARLRTPTRPLHGRPTAILIALEDLERLEETVAVLSDPATMARLAESDAELARGEGLTADDLAETLRARRSTG